MPQILPTIIELITIDVIDLARQWALPEYNVM